MCVYSDLFLNSFNELVDATFEAGPEQPNVCILAIVQLFIFVHVNSLLLS